MYTPPENKSFFRIFVTALVIVLFLTDSIAADWTSIDIGSVGMPGYYERQNDIFIVKGSGEDVWDSQDQFQFVYQQISGDFTITARIISLTNTHYWAKAGVMIRESLAPDAMFINCNLAPGGLCMHQRTSTGSLADQVTNYQEGFRPPCWVRLVRDGDQFTAEYSQDGAQWNFFGASMIPMPENAYVGVMVCSHNNSRHCEARFDNVTLNAKNDNRWTSIDVGAVGIAGFFQQQNDVFIVKGSGEDVWDSQDQFQFVHQQISGDFTITARVCSLTNTHYWAKAGVMIRELLAPDAIFINCNLAPGGPGGLCMHQRTSTGSIAGQVTNYQEGFRPPCWVRLVRDGDQFTAEYSQDGAQWNFFGASMIPMLDTVYVGVMVCSHDNSRLCEARFDNVTVKGTENAITTSFATQQRTDMTFSGSQQQRSDTTSSAPQRESTFGVVTWDSNPDVMTLYIFYQAGNNKSDQFLIELEKSQFASKFPDLKVKWVDVKKNAALAKQLDIFVIPTAVMQMPDGSNDSIVCYGLEGDKFVKWVNKNSNPLR